MKIQHSRSISSSVILLLAISAHAATVWDGPMISFTKSNYANPLLAENQDRLTTNVWITRGSSQGLFNAKTESRFTHFVSPAGTEWANGSLEDYATLRYTNWNHWAAGVNPSPPSTVGVQAVLHLIPDDIYLSVRFTSWSRGAPGGGPTSGGGFSYLRSTPVPGPTNAMPIVTWQQPANNAAFPPGFALSLRAQATDSDGTVSNVNFFATPTSGPTINVGQGTLASDGYYVREWTNPPPGQYQLHAEAVDNAGGRGISDSVQIVVVDTSQPPTNAQTRTWTGADPSGYWSAPANWSPAGVLVNGDALVFPGGLPPADMVSTNDLTDRFFRSIRFNQGSRHTIRGNPITLTNRANCIIHDGTNVIACDLTFSGTPSLPTTGNPSIYSSSFNSGELTVIGNVGGGNLKVSVGSGRVVIRGQFTGGSLWVDWYSTLALYGDNPYAVSANVSGSTLLVEGSQPNLNVRMFYNIEDLTPASLSGDGLIGDVTWVAGNTRITPDSTLSVKNVSAYSPIFRLNGTNVGEYGRLVASGGVSLGTGSLLPSPGFNPQAGQVYTIVEKTSPGPITNAFFGTSEFLGPEGTVTTLNGMPIRISYVGGDGNDVTLTVETNTRPTVTITNPPNAAVFTAPASFSLAAAASDPDGSVTNVQFFRDATSLGNDSSSPYSVSVSGLAAGNYALSAVASDNHGLRATNSIVVTVAGPPPTTNTWTGADPSGNWSAPANWSPVGVPVNGNDLVFPGGLPPGDEVSTNDLTDRIFRSITFSGASRHTIRGNPITLTNRTDAILNSGTNVIACDLTFSGTPSTPAPTTIRSSSFGSGELTVIGNVGGGSLYVGVGVGRVVIRGQFTGGSLFVDWYSTLALYGDNPYAVSAFVEGSTLLVEGSQPNLNITMSYNIEDLTPASLSGDGLVGDVTRDGITLITPDSTLSVKNVSAGSLIIRLNGTNTGEYGKLVASGGVNLSGGRLLSSPGFNPQPGQVFTIVEKTSPGPITNPFLGPEGTVTNLNGMPFRINYVGGDGNDVTLTAEATNLGFVPVPIPGLPGVIGGSVAWGDYDNDGRLDFLLVGYGAGSQLWRNTGSGFSNVTASVAPGLPGVSSSVAWGDYDNDGRLDFLLTGSFRSQLWRNTGAGFSNVTASVAPGLPGLESSSVAWGDYDNDGRLDFLLTGTTNFFPDESPIYFQSQLWRNTGSGFSNVTASVAPGLPGLSWGSVGWGDYDNDGRLDFLLTASFGAGQLWRNTGSGFSNVTASVAPGPPGLFGRSVAWGDYDNDGRLDFLLTDHGTYVSQVWRNTGSGFSNVTASVAPGLPGVYQGSAAWGDYDNDGRLDFLLTGGVNGLSGISQVWRNTGGGFSNVTASVTPGLPGSLSGRSLAWGDYDNDGRLDFLLTPSGRLWRNNMPVASNAPPAAPTGLSSTLSGATVSLSWNPPADDRTPSTGLNYNLRIGTTPGASDVLAPMALADGLRLLPALGNAQAGTNAVMNLPFGRYYWSVQAVDTSFAGSPFAAEQQFTVAAPRIIEPLMLGNGHFQFSFSNETSVIYEVLATTNVALPLAQWNALGPPVPLGGGLYRFNDLLATNHTQRFYLLRAQ